jgi:hypothetical protein
VLRSDALFTATQAGRGALFFQLFEDVLHGFSLSDALN